MTKTRELLFVYYDLASCILSPTEMRVWIPYNEGKIIRSESFGTW